MQPSGSGLSPKAIGWALLSQSFWLPLLAIDIHDRWVARQREITPPGQALPPSSLARAKPFSLNDLLNAARPVQQLAGRAHEVVGSSLSQTVRGAASGVGVLLSSAGSSASSLLDRPFSLSLEAPSRPVAAGSPADGPGLDSLQSAHSLQGRAFTRAQLLGGSIGLSDLQEGPMAPLALAERAVQRGNTDPLAPLPSLWREPMRQALLRLPGGPQQLSPARLVHVPSTAVSQPLQVPLALQSDGSVDILQTPANPVVLREIEGWSRQQRLPATGSLLPAVVHLHPLPQLELITPPAGGPAPSASSAPRASAGSAAVKSTAAVGAPSASPATTGSASVSSAPASAATAAPLVPETPAPAAAEAPIPVPIVSETPDPAPAQASIPVPILSETPAAP